MSVFECPICLIDCHGMTCQTVPCFHEFCHPCMMGWILKSNKCPLDNCAFTEMFIYDKPRGELIQHFLIIDPSLRNTKEEYGIQIDDNTNNSLGLMYNVGNYTVDDSEDESQNEFQDYLEGNNNDDENELNGDNELNVVGNNNENVGNYVVEDSEDDSQNEFQDYIEGNNNDDDNELNSDNELNVVGNNNENEGNYVVDDSEDESLNEFQDYFEDNKNGDDNEFNGDNELNVVGNNFENQETCTKRKSTFSCSIS